MFTLLLKSHYFNHKTNVIDEFHFQGLFGILLLSGLMWQPIYLVFVWIGGDKICLEWNLSKIDFTELIIVELILVEVEATPTGFNSTMIFLHHNWFYQDFQKQSTHAKFGQNQGWPTSPWSIMILEVIHIHTILIK